MSPEKKRILVTGASGFVGQNLCRDLRGEFEVVGTYHGETPTEAPCKMVPFEAETGSVERLIEETNPDWVVHLLALTRGEACARDSERAFSINTHLARALGDSVKERNLRLVFTSTDLVFDRSQGSNTEEDRPQANGVYARTKIEAENELFGLFENRAEQLMVFRLALSYGWSDEGHPGPVGWIIRSLQEGKPVTLFRDEYRSPLYVGDIGKAVADTIRGDRSGLFHLAGAEKIDRYTMGIRLAEKFGLDPALCLSRSVADYEGSEPRSPDCSMSTDKFNRVFGWRPCGLEEGLNRMNSERY